jgi:hypothetical protein
MPGNPIAFHSSSTTQRTPTWPYVAYCPYFRLLSPSSPIARICLNRITLHRHHRGLQSWHLHPSQHRLPSILITHELVSVPQRESFGRWHGLRRISCNNPKYKSDFSPALTGWGRRLCCLGLCCCLVVGTEVRSLAIGFSAMILIAKSISKTLRGRGRRRRETWM